jgi:hypothetical protein
MKQTTKLTMPGYGPALWIIYWVRVVADSHIIYWYLGQWEHRSEKALQCVVTAEDDEGIIVSALTIPKAVDRIDAEEGTATCSLSRSRPRTVLIDPTTAIGVQPFGPDMWHHFE